MINDRRKSYRRKEDKLNEIDEASKSIFRFANIATFILVLLVNISGMFWSVTHNDHLFKNFIISLNNIIHLQAPFILTDVNLNENNQYVLESFYEDGVNGYCHGQNIIYEYVWKSNRNSIMKFNKIYKVVDQDTGEIYWQGPVIRELVIVTENGTNGVKEKTEIFPGDDIPLNMPMITHGNPEYYLLISGQADSGATTQIKVPFLFEDNCEVVTNDE